MLDLSIEVIANESDIQPLCICGTNQNNVTEQK